jgi:hypothetical protein
MVPRRLLRKFGSCAIGSAGAAENFSFVRIVIANRASPMRAAMNGEANIRNLESSIKVKSAIEVFCSAQFSSPKQIRLD